MSAYRSWWPWLSAFDGEAFAAGEAWTCRVQPPLPYSLRFVLHLDEVDEPRRATATISGDIEGSATIDLTPVDGGCELRLVSALAPSNPFLRGVARFARPVVRFGHDWVLGTGVEQFRRAAL